MITLIICTDQAHGIGLNNSIPWKIPLDTQYFYDQTMRKVVSNGVVSQKKNVVLMGRNTFESMNSVPLKGRINVIISRSLTQGPMGEDCWVVKSIEDGLKWCENNNHTNIFIIGGKQIYEHFLTKHIDILCITQILDADYGCDVKVKSELLEDQMRSMILATSKRFKVKDELSNTSVTVQFSRYYLDIAVYSNLEEVNSWETGYLELMDEIINKPKMRETRNAKVWSVFGRTLRFDLAKGFPLLTTRRVFLRGVFAETKEFLCGNTDMKKLSDQGVKVWDQNTNREFLDKCGLDYEEFDMGPMYPFQFRHYGLEYEGKDKKYIGGFDQLKYCLDLIKNDPNSRRIIETSFNPAQAQQGVLYPCHSLVIQFYVDADKVSMTCYNRSQDLFLGVVWNIAYAALTLHIVCNLVNNDPEYKGPRLSPGEMIIFMGDVHVYENHYEACCRQLLRAPYEFPKLSIGRELKSLNEINDLVFDDIVVEDYVSHSVIKADMVA